MLKRILYGNLLLAPDEVDGGSAAVEEPPSFQQPSDAEANAALAAQSRATQAEANSNPTEEGGKVEVMDTTKDFNFDEFTSTKDGSRDALNPPTKKVEPKPELKPTKEVTPKPTDNQKPGEEQEIEEEIKAPDIEDKEEEKEIIEEDTPEQKALDAKTKRDYTGFTKKERDMFRAMSREGFETLKPMYLEHKKLKQELNELKSKGPIKYEGDPNTLPANYFEHPEAVTLLPDFKAYSGALENLNLEKNFWQQQLVKIKKGEKASILDRNAEGKYITNGTLEPTVENEEMLREKVNLANQLSSQVQNNISQLVGGFRAKHEQAVTSLREAEAKFFPFFEKDLDKNPLKKDIDLALKSLPEPFKNHPMSRLLAKSYAVTTELSRQNKELKAKLANASTKASDTMRSGPTKEQILAKGGGVNGDEDDIMSEFNKVKQRE